MNHLSAPRLVAILSSLVLAAGCSPGSGEDRSRAEQDDHLDEVEGEIVVDFQDGTTKAEIDEMEKDWGVDLEFNSVEGQRDGIAIAKGVSSEDAVLAKIRQSSAVESAEAVHIYSAPPEDEWLDESGPVQVTGKGYIPNDPDFGKQWNLQLIHMPMAWEETHGKGAIVAVLDTGIAYEDYGDFKQVPDLKGAKFVKGYDFVNDTEHPNDDHGHGTHVAGTIAQMTNNGVGVAGVAFEATLMPVKVLDHFGSGTSADIADAIRWAADHGAQVINMSLGGGGYSQVMADAVRYAHKKGVVVVCAAGNSGAGRVEFPAAYPDAVAVAAVGPDGTRAPYSSYGKELDIAAPGGDKRRGEQFGVLQNTIDPRDPSQSVYAYYQGTSMATPHVAGVAALLWAAGARTPEEVEEALYAGATRVGGKDWTDQYGHGLLNAEKSLEAEGAGGAINWKPFFVAAGLLILVLVTLGPRNRPGYFNIFLKPGFFIPLILSTVGFFIARWFHGGGEAGQVFDALSWPLPDLDRIIFGRGKLANPLFYSAAIPLVVSFFAIKWKAMRPVIGGLAVGFAGFLAYAAFARAPALAWMPFTFLAIPWLAVNALVCLFIARAMLKREAAK